MMHHKNLSRNLFLILTPLFFNLNTMAQDGSLDASFDQDGLLIGNFGGDSDYANALAIQPDDKSVIVGFKGLDQVYSFAIARFNLDGSFDNSFSQNGIFLADLPGDVEEALDVIIQDDGKIVACGYSYDDTNVYLVCLRLNTDGTLDNTFDTDGMAVFTFDNAILGYSLQIQPDGKILIGGTISNATLDFAVVRLNGNGTIDNSFDADGVVATAMETDMYTPTDIVLQSDGKIVIAGSHYNGTNRDFALVRYNADGSLDNSFDNDGMFILDYGEYHDTGKSLTIQPDGKLILVGTYQVNSVNHIAVLRINSNGTLDSTFDPVGIGTSSTSFLSDEPQAVVLQSDGKILVSGYSLDEDGFRFMLAKLNADGSLDDSFGTNGFTLNSVGSLDDYSQAMGIQSDDKIVLAGYSGGQFSNNQFALARFNNSIILKVADNYAKQDITELFPNPFTSEAFFKSSETLNNISLVVYNIHGEVVSQLSMKVLEARQPVKLQRGNIPAGMYYFNLFEGTELIETRKFMIVD
jgi:uncharacterized delta-60 repeat protein